MPSRSARGVLAVVLGVGGVLSASSLVASATESDVGAVLLDFAVGWLFLGIGAAMWFRRPDRVGAWMIGTGVTWFLGGLYHRGPLVHLLLTFPTGRSSGRPTAVVIAFAYVDGVLGSWIPSDAATAVLASGITIVAAGRLARSSGPVRRGRLGAGLAALAVAAGLLSGHVPAFAGFDPGAMRLRLYEVILAVTAVALAADLLWGGWSRTAVTGLVVDLGGIAKTGNLRDRLARALGDPSLVVGYAVDGPGRYVDEAGQSIELPKPSSARVVTPVTQAGEPLAVLIHDPAVLGDRALVESVAAAAGLAVSNVRLQAEIQDRVAELEASQRRILVAEDRQRLRLERALTDGALARLVNVRDLVGQASAMAGDVIAPEVAPVLAELDESAAELARFARGVYPPSLAEHGLATAVAELAARCPVPTSVRIQVDPLPPTIETTVWFICSEALANVAKHSRANRAEILATAVHDRLELVVSDDGVGGADETGSGLNGLAQRVDALGGRMRVVSRPGAGTTVEVGLPLP
jgi:signal transduction histidine kinase